MRNFSVCFFPVLFYVSLLLGAVENCHELFFSKFMKESHPRGALRVAVIEFNPAYRKKSLNEKNLLEAISRARMLGARLIITPELSTTGYLFKNPKEVAPLAEPIPGPFTRTLSKLARKHRVNLVTSIAEIGENRDLYISAVFADENGKIFVHRKNRITDEDRKWATGGVNGPSVFDTSIGRVALGICMDVQCGRFVDKAYEEGAEIFISPTASNGEAITELENIAEKYPMVVMGANRNDIEKTDSSIHRMVGMSSVFDVSGRPLIRLPRSSGSGRNHSRIRIGIADVPSTYRYSRLRQTESIPRSAASGL